MYKGDLKPGTKMADYLSVNVVNSHIKVPRSFVHYLMNSPFNCAAVNSCQFASGIAALCKDRLR